MSQLRTNQLGTLDGTVTIDVKDIASHSYVDNKVDLATLPNDLIFFPNFRSDEDTDTRFMFSTDGVIYSSVSDNPLSTDGSDEPISMGPSGHIWVDGTLYLIVGWYSLGSWDATVYKTTDGFNFSRHRVNFGSTPIGSSTNPISGATHACDKVWSPFFVKDGDDIYVGLTLPYGNDFVDVNGNTIGDYRQYLSKCSSLDSLTFEYPTIVTQTSNANCQIDGMFYKYGDSWNLFSKNDYNKYIEHWTSSTLNGPYTKSSDVMTSGQAEAPYLVEWTESLPRFRLYADSYVTGSYIYSESNDLVSWTSTKQIEADRANRHGSFSNTSFMDDKSKELLKSILCSRTSKSGKGTVITASNTSFHPRDGYVYSITGTNSFELTISEYSAKEFYLVVSSQSPLCQLKVNVNSYYAGVGNGKPLILNGADHSNKIIRVKQIGSQYYTDAVTSLEQTAIALSTVSNFPTLSSFSPVVGNLYTTDGGSSYASVTTISGIASGYPDGANFYLQVQSDSGSNGQIQISSGATNMVTGTVTISPGTQQVYEVRKIAGYWRVMA
ncbi:hypothetical protein F3J37_17765 [Pantoea sp. Al-1710]|uniref:Uncharacterized protein n=1 Tax=Candidatus Pantoea communis TaxID=2608354 RepID=A0ABX0RTV0_9GAMM|nr:glycoside hydrolase family 43 protein [Pantoea communis]NIG20524.1 hypothetical protein [Pantoea communis]